jgi:branched-chain amino acid transport system ATP-binding protein
MLELSGLSVRYGAIRALEAVSLEVNQSEIVCLIGANGAGKSTVLNAISGVVPAWAGQVTLQGTSILGQRASKIVRGGIVQVPEGRLVFPDMTVSENLEMGAYSQRGDSSGTLRQIFSLFPRLDERRQQLAGLMSGGEQQMLAIGRALMAKPKVLLLDEPSMGLAPLVIADIFRTLRRLREQLGLSILLVEQNARAALALADRGYVLTSGRISAGGTSKELLADKATLEAFLGKTQSAAIDAGEPHPIQQPTGTTWRQHESVR